MGGFYMICFLFLKYLLVQQKELERLSLELSFKVDFVPMDLMIVK